MTLMATFAPSPGGNNSVHAYSGNGSGGPDAFDICFAFGVDGYHGLDSWLRAILGFHTGFGSQIGQDACSQNYMFRFISGTALAFNDNRAGPRCGARPRQPRSGPSARRPGCPPASGCQPLTGAATSGMPSRVARSMAGDDPVGRGPPDRSGQEAELARSSTAIRRPCIRASPVSTDSSTPDFSAAAASSAAYASLGRRHVVGAVSHEDHEPSSRTRSMRSRALSRSLIERG